MFAFPIAGFVVGAAVGMTGVGGGSLMTPLLILLFGFAPSAAVGTDLLYAAGTKAFGTWLHGRQQTVDWRVVGLMASGSIPAALLTVAVLHRIGMTPGVQQVMMLVLAGALDSVAPSPQLHDLADRAARDLQSLGAEAVVPPQIEVYACESPLITDTKVELSGGKEICVV